MNQNNYEIGTARDFYKFVNEKRRNILNKENRNLKKTNNDCKGTALYQVGEIPKEKFLFQDENEKILSNLKKAQNPEPGYIVAWRRENPYSMEGENQTYHMAVVVNKNPLKVATRNGEASNLNKNQSFTKVNGFYASQEPEGWVEYYIPSKLEKALNKSKSNSKKIK